MPEKLLLQLKDISKSYGDKVLFDQASVSISEKQKIGVVGRNGAGKTTFFKMILKQLEPDTGSILYMPHLQLGYIEQHDAFLPDETVIEFLQRYTSKPEWECAKIASRFQLKNDLLNKKIVDLSGGYQMRVKLTATLLFEPNLLLLDEPTNYLDLSTLLLLEEFLKSFKGSFMVITHDREFIKKTCTSTLDVAHGQLFLHPEPLEEYLQFRQEQEVLAQSINKNLSRKQNQLQEFVDKYGAKASKAKSAQSKMKQIEKLESKKIALPNAQSNVRMYIPSVEDKKGTALECKKLSVGYSQKIVLSNIDLEVERGKKVAILGDNGQGKSTFLKTIASELSPVSGIVNWRAGLKIGYYNQHVAQALDPKDNIEQYAKRQAKNNSTDDEVYRVLGNFLFKKTDYSKTIEVLSGGEKARLCLAGMFLTKADVYLLDEPTNHLDFETIESMGLALGHFNGTVFVVSHNRTFVNLIANEIMEVGGGAIKRVLGTYEDYVWTLQQQLKAEDQGVISDPENKYADTNSKLPNDKETRRKLYELNKQLSSLERRMSNLQNLISQGCEVEKNQVKLNNVETDWLYTQSAIEDLKVPNKS